MYAGLLPITPLHGCCVMEGRKVVVTTGEEEVVVATAGVVRAGGLVVVTGANVGSVITIGTNVAIMDVRCFRGRCFKKKW